MNEELKFVEIPHGIHKEVQSLAEDIRKFTIEHHDMKESDVYNNLNHFYSAIFFDIYEVIFYLHLYAEDQMANELLDKLIDLMAWKIQAEMNVE